MRLKDSLLFSLFRASLGEKLEGVEETEPQEEAQEEPVVEEPPRRPRGPQMDLPAEHPVNKLRDIWAARSGWQPFPELYFDSTSERYEPLSESDAKRELSRLQVLVMTTAKKRLSQAQETKDGVEPSLNAEAMIFLTADQMSAWLLAYPPVGEGKELDRDQLTRVMADNGVKFGIEEELLDSLPEHQERYFHLFMVAHGKRPVEGKEGRVVDLFPRRVRREPKMDEFGRVDYRALNLVQNVEKGDTICQIYQSIPGENGRTVQDKEISAKPIKTLQIPKGNNTDISKDGTLLVATQAGNVEYNGRTFQVKPIFYIDGNVDYSTGNITFWGDVRVRGDVCSGFEVKATGTVTVDGVVEACTIEAGCDLIVSSGVQGNDQAVLRAHRNIYAKYLENCNVYTKENLRTDCLLNCNVYSNGMIQATSGRGVIIGGTIRAAHEVKARSVGSKTEVVTKILLGGLPFEEFEYENLKKELDGLKEELERLKNQPESRAKISQMTKLRLKLISDQNKLEQYEDELAMLKQEAKETETEPGDTKGQETKQDDRKLVSDIVYPGTVVAFGENIFKVQEEIRHCRITLVNDQVCI